MSTDTSAAAVERLADVLANSYPYGGPTRTEIEEAAATLRALLAERDAAELTMHTAIKAVERANAEREAARAEAARMRDVVTKAFSAINAAYAQAHAEQAGHDLTASKHDAAVYAWREQARAALAGEPAP